MKSQHFPDAATIWNQRFSEPEFLFGTPPNVYLASQCHFFGNEKTALAVADGKGRNRVWPAQHGWVFEAFDISSVGVTKARRLAQQAGVSVNFHVFDCDAWPWKPAAYHHVVAVFVQFADADMRRRLFMNMVSTLELGGNLNLQGYTPKQLEFNTGGRSILDHLYTEDLLRSEFSGLHISELNLYEAVLSEGKQHYGRLH